MRPFKEQQTLLLLTQLSQELQTLTLWQECKPTPCELASTMPFHYDTLTFEQWLQFIFIERIGLIIENDQTLPNEISLLPIAEESFKSLGDKASKLLEIIQQLDCLLSDKNIND